MLALLSGLVTDCGTIKNQHKADKKKMSWYWDKVHQKAFDDMKEVIVCDVVLSYPDFDKTFEIFTYASSRQLGEAITQNNRPISFFSQKLSNTQKGIL